MTPSTHSISKKGRKRHRLRQGTLLQMNAHGDIAKQDDRHKNFFSPMDIFILFAARLLFAHIHFTIAKNGACCTVFNGQRAVFWHAHGMGLPRGFPAFSPV